jgi:hypothetical protein
MQILHPWATTPSSCAAAISTALRLALCGTLLVQQATAHAQKTVDPSSAPNQTNSTTGPNSITQAAVQRGVLNCAVRINQVTNFLGFGAQAGALVMVAPSEPDQHLIPVAMEVPTQWGTAYVSAAFAPNQSNGCGAAYDAVMYWPLPCEDVAAAQFANFKRVRQLQKDITVLDGGVTTKVFLLKAGTGCVSIKKEVVL